MFLAQCKRRAKNTFDFNEHLSKLDIMSWINRSFNLIVKRKELLRGVLAVCIIVVGITHFIRPDQYARIVPPAFPDPVAMVYISGVFEILGGIGLTIPFVSVAAAWGLVALFVAVFPANIYQTLHSIPIEGIPHHPLLYWFRLPFQAVLVMWAWWYTRRPQDQKGADQIVSWVKPRSE